MIFILFISHHNVQQETYRRTTLWDGKMAAGLSCSIIIYRWRFTCINSSHIDDKYMNASLIDGMFYAFFHHHTCYFFWQKNKHRSQLSSYKTEIFYSQNASSVINNHHNRWNIPTYADITWQDAFGRRKSWCIMLFAVDVSCHSAMNTTRQTSELITKQKSMKYFAHFRLYSYFYQ